MAKDGQPPADKTSEERRDQDPKNGQFVQGNRAGRKWSSTNQPKRRRKRPDFGTLLRKRLTELGKRQEFLDALILASMDIPSGKSGHAKAYQMALERMFGKVPDQVLFEGTIDLNEGNAADDIPARDLDDDADRDS